MTKRAKAFDIPAHLNGEPAAPAEWLQLGDCWLRLSSISWVRYDRHIVYVAFAGGDARTFEAKHWPELAAALGIEEEGA